MSDDIEKIAASLAKTMALMCVRNTKLEDLHAGKVPISKIGDFSDVTVIDAEGREIPWLEVSHFDDDVMRELMKQVVNRLYTFHVKAGDPHFLEMINSWSSVTMKWDEPELDATFLKANEQYRKMGDG